MPAPIVRTAIGARRVVVSDRSFGCKVGGEGIEVRTLALFQELGSGH